MDKQRDISTKKEKANVEIKKKKGSRSRFANPMID